MENRSDNKSENKSETRSEHKSNRFPPKNGNNQAHSASALIVAKPGRTRDSLQAMVASIKQISTVNQADSGTSALQAINTSVPSLILLDTNLPDNDTWNTLKQIKSRWPQIPCIILAGNLQQQGQATTCGADRVLLAGISAAQLFAVIEELLTVSRKERKNSNGAKLS